MDHLTEKAENPRESQVINETSVPSLITQLQTSLEVQFEELKTSLMTSIDEKIKATNISGENNGSESAFTYAKMAGNNTNQENYSSFRAIMMSTKNEELTEKNEKKRRTCNLIVHGKTESDSTTDADFTKALLKDIEVGAVKAKEVERVGREAEDKIRPIKIVFASEEEKEKVLSNLSNLKGKQLYKGISIKEDHTPNERQLIREFSKQAREENSKLPEDSNYIIRVRGSPKNGLFLKKVKKIIPEQTE